jgi:hypothetical protein
MSRQDVFIGAALEYWRSLFQGVAVENENTVSVSTSVLSAINGNGDRMGLLIMNLGAANVFVAVSSAVSSSFGILLGANGGFVSLNVRDDFTMQTRQWWAVCPTGGPSTIYTLELTRTGAPMGPP